MNAGRGTPNSELKEAKELLSRFLENHGCIDSYNHDLDEDARAFLKNAAPQPSTAKSNSAPSQEGAGQGDAAAAAQCGPDCSETVLRLLNHIEDVVDDYNWEQIDPQLWNAVTALCATPETGR